MPTNNINNNKNTASAATAASGGGGGGSGGSKASQQPATTTSSSTRKKVHHGIEFIKYWKQHHPGQGEGEEGDSGGEPPQPKVAVDSKEEARPGYTKISASEYLDTKAVLDAKIDFLLQMWSDATYPCFYAGAGCSTGSTGLADYASRAKGSIVQARETGNRLKIDPGLVHRVVSAIHHQKHKISQLITQNHDCLFQKAGFIKYTGKHTGAPFAEDGVSPQNDFEIVNPIHGEWQDANNRVLQMDDKLRPDLLERLLDTTKKTDFVFAVGSSMSGMTADSVAEHCAYKKIQQGLGQGLAILTLQETRLDSQCALHIFAPIDSVFAEIQKRWKLKIESKVYDVPRRPAYHRPIAARSPATKSPPSKTPPTKSPPSKTPPSKTPPKQSPSSTPKAN